MGFEKDLEKHPWPAYVGILLFVSLFLYCMSNPDFWPRLVPIYATEGLMLICLGCVMAGAYMPSNLSKPKAEKLVAIMAFLWMAGQVWIWVSPMGAVWGSTAWDINAYILWLLAIVQIYLTYSFFQGDVPFTIGLSWGTDVSIALLAFFAVMKIALNLGMTGYFSVFSDGWQAVAGLNQFMMAGWGVGILLICLAYLLPKQGVNETWVPYISLVGFGLAALVALTINAAGLTLLALV